MKNSDLFKILKFHHLEFYVGDSKSVAKLFKSALGMSLIAMSNQETGNHKYYSNILKTNNFMIIVTSPNNDSTSDMMSWINKHGNGIYAVALEVENADNAYKIAIKNGAISVSDPKKYKYNNKEINIAEVLLYGNETDTILRFVSYDDNYELPYTPNYKLVKSTQEINIYDINANIYDINRNIYDVGYGIIEIDHVVGNVYDMNNVVDYIRNILGLHIFAEFTKEDIQTKWTSLNSKVLSNNSGSVLLPVNEPVFKKRMSQIEEYLKYNNGVGVQHVALKTNDIFYTIGKMKQSCNSFEFLETPKEYYNDYRICNIMKKFSFHEQSLIKKYSILVDEDNDGILLQIFTEPLFDRPTVFIEIIQRICKNDPVPGCGAFGKGNFRALFESIERMQKLRGNL